MKLPNRTVSIFTLSALDVLAMATGTFVLLVVMMMPYYRRTFDAGAEMSELRVATLQHQAEIEAARRAAAADMTAAREAEAEAEAAAKRAAAARSAAARLRRAAATTGGATVRRRAAPDRQTSAERPVLEALDLVFVIDASGSMTRAIRELRLSLRGIVRVLERLVPSLRVGFVAYRDYDVGSWVVRPLPLTPTASRLDQVLAFASSIKAARVGGSTVTEALAAGLERAMRMRFRADAKQTLIVIGDAAAHPSEQAKALALARRFAAGNPLRSVSTLFVNTLSYMRYGRGDRRFFAELARAGNGTFSDHRGEMMESILLSVIEE